MKITEQQQKTSIFSTETTKPSKLISLDSQQRNLVTDSLIKWAIAIETKKFSPLALEKSSLEREPEWALDPHASCICIMGFYADDTPDPWAVLEPTRASPIQTLETTSFTCWPTQTKLSRCWRTRKRHNDCEPRNVKQGFRSFSKSLYWPPTKKTILWMMHAGCQRKMLQECKMSILGYAHEI